MLRLFLSILFAALVVAATGCSRGADVGKGYNSKSGDLGAFILSSAPKFGLRVLTTNDLPQIPAKWRYKEGSTELQLFVEGNYFPQLHTFLTKAVGPPPGPPMTNSLTRLRSIEAYYGTNFGATVNCAWESADDGKQYTRVVIVGYGQPTMSQNQVAQYFKAMAQEAEKGNQYFKALDAARPSAPYLSDFLGLFPKAEVNYRYFTSSGEPGYDVEVDLHERYELLMQLPVHFDSSRRNVIGYGEPKFYLGEATNVVKRQTWFNPASARTFGSAEWKKIVEGEGDFRAIGYAMITNRPVPGFKNRKIVE